MNYENREQSLSLLCQGRDYRIKSRVENVGETRFVGTEDN